MRSALIVKFAKPLVVGLALLAVSLPLSGCDDDTPTTPTETPTTATVTFATTLARGGASTRSFEVTRNGVVSVTLTEVGTVTSPRVGLGVGIPLEDGTGCVLSRSLETNAGATAQIELTVDIGNYCVQIYDAGTLTTAVPFKITLVYPIEVT